MSREIISQQINTVPNGSVCQEPSKQYLDMLDECGDDPRVVASQYALSKSGPLAEKGWVPDWEARDARNLMLPNIQYNVPK